MSDARLGHARKSSTCTLQHRLRDMTLRVDRAPLMGAPPSGAP